MFIQSAQNIQLTNLIVGDSYRLVFSQLNNNASVEPQVIEFIANNLTQNISFLVSYDTNTLVTLRIDTINLSKNKINTDSILIKCNDYDLCAVASTPKATRSPTPTTTPTPTKTKNIILTTPTTTPTRSPTSFATPTPTPTPSNACVPNKPISVEAVCEPCVGNTDENSNITVKVTVIGDPKTCSDFDYFVAQMFLAEYPVGDTGLVDGFGASQDTFIFSLPKLYGGNSDQLYGFRVKAVSSPIDGSDRESEYTYAPQQFSRNLCCPVTQTPTPSLTVTPSITPTLTSTSTNTPTTTPTKTITPTITRTATASSTPITTVSASSTSTPTPTPTNLVTGLLYLDFAEEPLINKGSASVNLGYSGNISLSNSTAIFDGYSFISGVMNTNSGWWDNDFTIDCWIKLNTLNKYQTILDYGLIPPFGATGGLHLWISPSNTIAFDNGQSPALNGGSISIDTWTHIAAVHYADGSNKLYVNGTDIGGINSQTFPIITNEFGIGNAVKYTSPYDLYFNGNIDNLRIIQTLLYTGNFTPPAR